MKITIEIPDNCELVKDGEKYIVKEKKTDPSVPPKTWEEFCERYPVKNGECFIDHADGGTPITEASFSIGRYRESKSWCTSKEEAEAFLALMQLRQLRKAWVGDWIQSGALSYSIYASRGIPLDVGAFIMNKVLSFPTEKLARDFLECFRDLCETAKMLL